MIRTQVDGLDSLVRDLTFASEAVRPMAGQVVVKAAEKAADRMRSRVPIRTGKTLESIDHDTEATEQGTAVYADAGSDFFVARFLEYGTARMAPRPWAEPAAAEATPDFIRGMEALHGGLFQ